LIASFNGSKPKTLVRPHYGEFNPDLLAEPKHIRYESFDGLEIPAILYEPPTAGKHPALIEIHRGPWWQHFLYFNIFAQAFVSEGYVLLQPNIRGSEGYGKAFKDMVIRDWGGGELEDVAHAARYLKTIPTVDEERIGIWGTRYGGYVSLLALLKKPDLWSAGCAVSSITHLRTLYERSDVEYRMMLNMFMGDPETDATLWEERSPLNYARNLSCPLLITHSAGDQICPVEESRQLRSRLIELGRKEGEDFEYVELSKGSYAHSDPRARFELITLIIDFFNRRLKPRTAASRSGGQ
jgi:dipeptidyl aminopeptidase/acylaminoacyl peptidase